MKLKMLTGLSALILAFGLAGCKTAAPATDVTGQSLDSSRQSTGTMVAAPTAAATVINREQAQNAALAHAGLSDPDVTWIRVNLDRDDGRQVYDVEFLSGNYEYDYHIDAATGQITGFDMELDKFAALSGKPGELSLDENAAKELALAKVPGAAASDLRIRPDDDDGRPVYEGTIIYNKMKYDFEIGAADGIFYEWSMESVYDD